VTQEQLERALAAAAEGPLVLRGDARHPEPAGSEHYMHALARWAAARGCLETEEERAPAPFAERWEGGDAAPLALEEPAPAGAQEGRALDWRNALVLDERGRPGVCLDVLLGPGPTAKRAPAARPDCWAAVCFGPPLPRSGSWVPAPGAPPAAREPVSRLRRCAAMPVSAAARLPSGWFRAVRLDGPFEHWEGADLRAAQRLAREAVVVPPGCAGEARARAEEATSAFGAEHLSLLPALLEAALE
jgi:hypothetical protein